ncbi:2TM domain-containing protein [Chitinophaga polysaccharea]|uniref:2TM domain-containing protein n=1 Tax=Chitinophaga TaxID=79328 RepID=UPI0014556CAC|nr:MULTISPECIES: 2TM domain-containing protein [Chitinophaga]NLR61914.1 2TM domain-containing protein [Chitinophaga polysaccharea]NLU94463.1 2TM domain-containing protein [Chitinophaga sp. Ak27]
METSQERDERLWRIAKARARFKSHLIIYLVINLGLWAVWFLTDSNKMHGTPWPVWMSLGWGIALAFQYFNAYHKDPYGDALKEYEKLQEQQHTRP